MNLTSMFRKDAALIDLNWMQNGIVHPGQPQLDLSKVKKNNDTKPDLEIEWGTGGVDVDIDQPAGIVERNLPEDAQADAGSVIVFARDMMNRGQRLSKITAALRNRFSKETLSKAREGLVQVFKGNGIIGRIAVDATGYRSCTEALKAASNSPYKRFIRFVVGCECGDPHLVASRGSRAFSEVASSGNPTDDFLASDNKADTVMTAHCRSTMLPRVAAVGDLDTSELDPTFIEVMDITGLPSGAKDQIAASKTSTLGKLRAAFRYLDRQADMDEASKYAGKVSSAEHRLAQAPMEFDIIQPMEGDIDVVEEVGPITIDMLNEAASPDVELDQFLDPEFEGTGDVLVDDPSVPMGVMDVEMLPRLDDEDVEIVAGKKGK